MGDTRQKIHKERDIICIQPPVMFKETADRAPGVAAAEHTVATSAGL